MQVRRECDPEAEKTEIHHVAEPMHFQRKLCVTVITREQAVSGLGFQVLRVQQRRHEHGMA